MISKFRKPYVEYSGKRWGIRPEFFRVLQCFSIIRDPELLPEDQIDICLHLLVRNCLRLHFLPLEKRTGLFQAVVEQYISSGKKLREKVLDFEHDAPHIYSSFAAAYQIDLTRSRLPWKQFLALLTGLPGDTMLSRILSIRQRPLPKPTKYNADERARLTRLKVEWAVYKTPEEREQDKQEGLRRMVMAMDAMARR